MPPFIVTLGTLTAVRGFARLLGKDTTIINSSLPFAFVGQESFLGIPFLVWIAAAVIVASWFVLRRTVFGIYVYSVGGNADGARLAGIRVRKVFLLVYSISGLCAGLGGVMSVGRLYAANGIQLGQSYELDAIAAVILGGTSFVGGTGSIWGTSGGRGHHSGDEQRPHPHWGAGHLAVYRKGISDHRRCHVGPVSPVELRAHLTPDVLSRLTAKGCTCNGKAAKVAAQLPRQCGRDLATGSVCRTASRLGT